MQTIIEKMATKLEGQFSDEFLSSNDIRLKVWITKHSKTFRAEVKLGIEVVEVTVNGSEWKRGKLQPFQAAILRRCENLVANLICKLKEEKV